VTSRRVHDQIVDVSTAIHPVVPDSTAVVVGDAADDRGGRCAGHRVEADHRDRSADAVVPPIIVEFIVIVVVLVTILPALVRALLDLVSPLRVYSLLARLPSIAAVATRTLAILFSVRAAVSAG